MRYLLPIDFGLQRTQKLLCQSSCAPVPSESHAHFNIYWNVIKTSQSDSQQSMLCSGSSLLSLLSQLLLVLRPFTVLSMKKRCESLPLNHARLNEGDQLRLNFYKCKCVLIDSAWYHSLWMRWTYCMSRGEHHVSQICLARFSSGPNIRAKLNNIKLLGKNKWFRILCFSLLNI